MSVPYLNLSPQYDRIKEPINARFQAIFNHGQFIMGPEVTEAEKALSKAIGCKHSLVCSNGTVALQMALMAANIQSGDEVIVPAFSFFASSEAVNLVGATPVFVDIEPDTFNIDVSKIKAAITDKTKAIMPVSLYGQIVDMDEINDIAKNHNLIVIEDAAQSFGADYKNKKSGNLCDIATTSFFPAKPLGGYGDGGAIFTNNDDLAMSLKQIRDHGSESRYHHTRIGLNGRLNSFQCAVILEKLKIYDEEVHLRSEKANIYNEHLNDVNHLITPSVKSDRQSVWAQYTVKVKDRDNFQKKLGKKGVPSSVHYPSPLPDQPVYANGTAASRTSSKEVAQKCSQQVISLPLYPYMPTEDQQTIIKAVKEVLS